MHGNTPPHVPEIDEDETELIEFDQDEMPLEDDDEDELEEMALEEFERRLNASASDDEDLTAHGNVKDDSLVTFANHTAPVFSCAFHPILDLAVTGGEDDRAYLWHTQTGELITELAEHKDTLTEVHFNCEGNYLATGDMAGEIMVHKFALNENSSLSPTDDNILNLYTLRKVWDYSMGDMTWMRWHNAANVLIAGSDSGEIYIWRIPSGECKILPADGIRCEAGSLTSDGKKLFAAYKNGALKLWDLKSCKVLMEVDAQDPMAHKDGVTSVACDRESPLYMSGGMDGKIVFCTNTGPCGVVQASGPVECVSFPPNPDMRIAASATLDGQIAIWDYTKYTLRTLCDHTEDNDGITRLKWLNDHTLLATTIQGNIYGFDARSGARKFTLTGHLADIYEVCYKAVDQILLSVSEDNTAKIFQVPHLAD